MTDGGDYEFCGWRLTSAIALPDLSYWCGDARPPDIVIAFGEAAPLEAPTMSTPLVAIDAAGRLRFSITGVADYVVEGGKRISVAPAEGSRHDAIRLFLMGSALGYLCHQRGVLPLHGAAVDIDGAAVILAGASGAGKSTLADAFARRGHIVLSDDVTPVALASGMATVLPGLRRIRLWKDAIDNAGWNSEALERCRTGLEKFSRSLHEEPRAEPLPPQAIFHLRRQWDKRGDIRVNRLRGRTAADQFREQIYRWKSLVCLAGAHGALTRSLSVAGAIPDHFVIERPIHFDRLDDVADEIIRQVRFCR